MLKGFRNLLIGASFGFLLPIYVSSWFIPGAVSFWGLAVDGIIAGGIAGLIGGAMGGRLGKTGWWAVIGAIIGGLSVVGILTFRIWSILMSNFLAP